MWKTGEEWGCAGWRSSGLVWASTCKFLLPLGCVPTLFIPFVKNFQEMQWWSTIIDELSISLVNSEQWGDQVGNIHLLKKGWVQKIGRYFLWKIWNRPLSHIQTWRVVNSPSLEGHDTRPKVAWVEGNIKASKRDCRHGTEGREFSQWVTSKGIVQLDDIGL